MDNLIFVALTVTQQARAAAERARGSSTTGDKPILIKVSLDPVHVSEPYDCDDFVPVTIE